MPICLETAGCSSMFILTSFTLPLAARTTFSRIGVSCLQGPHQGAQKSMSTGWCFDSSMTSFTKVLVVVSLMRPSAAAAVVAPTLFCSIAGVPQPRRVGRNGWFRWRLHGGYGPRMQSAHYSPGLACVPAKACPGLEPGSHNLAARHRLDPGLVAGRIEKPPQIVASDRGRHR